MIDMGSLMVLSMIPMNAEPIAEGDQKVTSGSASLPLIFTGSRPGFPPLSEARVHPLSLAVPLAFVLERQAEVRQIRLVLRGTEFGLPADELLALMERYDR